MATYAEDTVCVVIVQGCRWRQKVDQLGAMSSLVAWWITYDSIGLDAHTVRVA